MKIEGGYYIKARKIQESEIAHQPPHVREIWEWLIMNANHVDKRYNGFLVKRGQLFRTYSDIREGLHWMVGWRKMTYNENQTKKAMKFLREARMIDTRKEPGGVLITVCNYDLYQNPKNYERTNESTTERTIAEPLLNHTLPYNNKNVTMEECKKSNSSVDSEVVKRILNFLNDKTGSKYKHTSRKTKDLINARIKEGFTEKDFYIVIGKKVIQWIDDDKMSVYLRPETLFSPKFESYLNEVSIKRKVHDQPPDDWNAQ